MQAGESTHACKNTRYQALLESNAVAVQHMQAAHDQHQSTLRTVKQILADRKIPTRVSYRARFRPEDSDDALIITIHVIRVGWYTRCASCGDPRSCLGV